MSRVTATFSHARAVNGRSDVTPETPALAVVCDILCQQLAIIRYNTRLAIRTRGVEAIHDLRVAIRRFRTALHVFNPFLRETQADRISRQLRTVNRRLGPIRDAQVWNEFLTAQSQAVDASGSPPWERCLKYAGTSRLTRERAIAGILASPPHRVLLQQASRLVRTDIPRAHRRAHAVQGSHFLAGALLKTCVRLTRSYKVALSGNIEDAHRFRRRCRRARYLAEFACPVLGRMAGKLARRLKDVADALGDRHDAEVQLEHLIRCTDPPEKLLRTVKRFREKSLRQFDKAWKRLFAPRFMKALRKNLGAYNGGSK